MATTRALAGIVILLVLSAFAGTCGGTATPTATEARLTASATATARPQPTSTITMVPATATTEPPPSLAATVAEPVGNAMAEAMASPDDATAASPTATTEPETVEVKILDFEFEPATLAIPAGTTVTWRNYGVDHTVFTFDRTFTSPLLPEGRGETFSVTFTQPGTYQYICGVHPEMEGTIIVR